MRKKIGKLAALVPGAEVRGNADTFVTDIVQDSRQVTPGALFVCVAGEHVDGHKFIPDVKAKGAAAIVTERDIEPQQGIVVLKVPNLDEALQVIVPFFFDVPSQRLRLIGITGTNGKTTTSFLLRSILRHAGHKVGLIGTIQTMIEEQRLPSQNTTPNIVDLQRLLAQMVEDGIEYVVMEVSSHALAQNRVAGCEFDTAVFTNFTQDHLDYHKTMENYLAAKAKLFEGLGGPGIKPDKTAVVNLDDEQAQYILERSQCRHLTYALGDESADLRAVDIKLGPLGSEFTIQGAFGRLPVRTHIAGLFNIYNVLSATGAAAAENVPYAVIGEAVSEFRGVPGRFETVDAGQLFNVVVDYAHTPDGLENILHTARDITENRIITVFGCGGDRDRTKRPIMGRIAAQLSDIVITTSDNPRTEDPEAILAEVEAGVAEVIGKKTHEKVTDRREAIYLAISLAHAGDTVIIAGKGHEDYQIIGTEKVHFDDREVAREALGGLG